MTPPPAPWREMLGLALAAAVSLGLARFSYAPLLPPMRADLGWSYALAGAMNTANAAGYLLGALWMPRALRRHDARALMLAGGLAAALLLALHGVLRSDAALAALRLATGAASALSFVGGGLLAARLASQVPAQGALVLGVTYGGVGLGIVVSALLVPAVAGIGAGWPAAWVALGAAALLAGAGTALGTRRLRAPPVPGTPRRPVAWRPFVPALAGYTLFGLGYIGYMTFIVTLLREQGLGGGAITAFYLLLGLAVVASSWLWAPLLQRHRSGRALATLNALLALATLLPVLSGHVVPVFASGLLFGAVFLSVVASTTAWVRHNLDAADWPGGISAFTTVFAGGQIVGPTVVGWIADASGSLAGGLAVSAALLALGAVCAGLQRALPRPPPR